MSFEALREAVEQGVQGRNSGIPMGFNRLNRYIGIRKRMYFVTGGLTGCLSGDTVISVNRGSRPSGREYTLRELYFKFNKKLVPRNKGDKVNGNIWDDQVSRILSYNHHDQVLRYNDVVNVIESGVKEVFNLRTSSGKTIKATKDHRFLVDNHDSYKRLEELKVGDFVFVRSKKIPKGRNPRPYRKELVTKLPYYPSATNKLVKVDGKEYVHQRIKITRLVYDAGLNNVTVEEFIKNVKNNPNHNYIFSDLTMDIHHIDGNHQNDVFENLKLMTPSEHAKYHGKLIGEKHFLNRNIEKDEIISIESCGFEMTYDIEMKSPYNNFLANGIVVHNSGKTSFVDDAFVLNPYDWFINQKDSKIKLKIIYRSMERSRTYKLAKWVCRRIFLDEGYIIPVSKLMGWTDKLTKDEHDLFLSYKNYMEGMDEIITIIDGPENPVGIAKQLKDHAMKNGTIEQLDKYNKIYIPNDENEITIVVVDHLGLLKTTSDFSTKKATIDKMSDELRYARDMYGYTIVAVQQFNRDISNPIRIKNGDVEPQLEDFKESSVPQEDADVVMALFDPMRYKVGDPSGYNLDKLKDEYGAKYFRSLRLIKNSYGEDDVRIGLGFMGQIGMFKELPRKKDITDIDYENVVNKSFFLNDQHSSTL